MDVIEVDETVTVEEEKQDKGPVSCYSDSLPSVRLLPVSSSKGR